MLPVSLLFLLPFDTSMIRDNDPTELSRRLKITAGRLFLRSRSLALLGLSEEDDMSEILVPAESDEKCFSENRGPILTIAVPTYNRSAKLHSF